jgi:hypothetical protein
MDFLSYLFKEKLQEYSKMESSPMLTIHKTQISSLEINLNPKTH